eukprot:480508_1
MAQDKEVKHEDETALQMATRVCDTANQKIQRLQGDLDDLASCCQQGTIPQAITEKMATLVDKKNEASMELAIWVGLIKDIMAGTMVKRVVTGDTPNGDEDCITPDGGDVITPHGGDTLGGNDTLGGKDTLDSDTFGGKDKKKHRATCATKD